MKFACRFDPAVFLKFGGMFVIAAAGFYLRLGWIGVGLVGGILLLLSLCSLPCHYTFKGDKLVCRCGLYVVRVDLSDIVSVSSDSSQTASPK